MGGSPGHIKKVKLDINLTPQGGKVRMLLNLQATLARTCQHGSLSVAEADHAVGDVEVLLIVVLENQCSGTVTEDLRTLKSLVNYCAVSPVPFATKKCKAAAKERLKFPLRNQRNKFCELCFFCRSLCFCPKCDKCPQCCSCPTSRRAPSARLANLGPPGSWS